MKLLNITFGIAAVRVPVDTVFPVKQVVIRDLLNAIAQTYEFAVRPNIQLALSANQFIFQAGVWKKGEERVPILQLMSFQNGDLVMASRTEIADEILTDFTRYLTQSFGFRYDTVKQQRFYQSNVVVQFSDDLAKKIDALQRIETLLNKGRDSALPPIKIKRLSFGYGDPSPPAPTIESIESSDFVIERRAGMPYSENVFFCSAPVQTEAHLALLREIEALA